MYKIIHKPTGKVAYTPQSGTREDCIEALHMCLEYIPPSVDTGLRIVKVKGGTS